MRISQKRERGGVEAAQNIGELGFLNCVYIYIYIRLV